MIHISALPLPFLAGCMSMKLGWTLHRPLHGTPMQLMRGSRCAPDIFMASTALATRVKAISDAWLSKAIALRLFMSLLPALMSAHHRKQSSTIQSV